MKKVKNKLKKCVTAACSFCKKIWKSLFNLQLYPFTKITMLTYPIVYILWKIAIMNVSISMREAPMIDMARRVSPPVALTFMRRFFSFSLSHLWQGNIISLFGSVFSHFRFNNVLHNVLALLTFGSFVEQRAGSLVFFTIISLTGVVGHLIQAIFDEKVLKLISHSILGANASIFGLVGFATFFYQEMFLEQNFLALIFYFLYLTRDDTSLKTAIYNNIGNISGLLTGCLVGVWAKNQNSKEKKNSYKSLIEKYGAKT